MVDKILIKKGNLRVLLPQEGQEVREYKSAQILMTITYVYVKVLFTELLNNRKVKEKALSEFSNEEQFHLHFYGPALIVLVTDLIYRLYQQ